jgi:hypothetical protein
MSLRTGIFGRAVLLFGLLAFSGTLAPALAAELLMVERVGCPYCAKWVRDVAEIYPLTPEGRRLPVRRVDLADGQPRGAQRPVRFTPTFLVMDEGREVGRITGYMDHSMFWGMLGTLLERLGQETATAGQGTIAAQ